MRYPITTMLVETDDFNPRFEPCPPELMKSTARAQLIVLAACGHQRKGLPPDEEIVHHLIDASVYLFIVGLQFYGMSGWLCSDYIPVYRLSGDSFKTAADGFALSPETRLLAFAPMSCQSPFGALTLRNIFAPKAGRSYLTGGLHSPRLSAYLMSSSKLKHFCSALAASIFSGSFGTC